MARRGELTDEVWERIALPARERPAWQAVEGPSRGRKRHLVEDQDRGALAGPALSLQAPWQTCYDRFARWRRDGAWDRLLARAQMKSDAASELVWEVSVDSTISRAHQHAAGARRRASREDAKRGSPTRRTKRSGGAGAG